MKLKLLLILFLLSPGMVVFAQVSSGARIISYIADPKVQDIRFYWKDDSGQQFRSIERLKNFLLQKHKKPVFAMNGGMFAPDIVPQGLFIHSGNCLRRWIRAAAPATFI